jgi:acyl-CoA reductase-like NAD-dependent aldehyde dehydrogenase
VATLTFKNFINGEWIAKGSAGTFEDRNPADKDDLIGVAPSSTKAEVDAAVAAAKAAFPVWSKWPVQKRADVIRKAAEILLQRKTETTKLMTREMGKVLKEAGGDVQEAIDCGWYYAGEGRRLFGQMSHSELPDKMAYAMRRPIGVCGLITPWNFPVAIPSWKSFPALVCGNTVVLKPAPDTPGTACKFIEALEEAGVPKGVVNLVHGGGPEVGQVLAEHPDVQVVSFTGSSKVGKHLSGVTGPKLKRLCLELGGKNGQIVMDDADLDLAVEGAVWGAFGTTGQRCTATSRLIVHKKVVDAFTGKFMERAKKMRAGNGANPDVDFGPLVSEIQRKRVHEWVQIGKNEDKAELLMGGDFLKDGDCAKGWFYQPTLFANCKSSMQICQEEIFGPVTTIIPVSSYEEAIQVINGVRYGLSSSIYTSNVTLAMRALHEIEAGITYVNGATIGAEVHLPFGGVKETGNGHREAGTAALDFYSEWKAAYCDFSGKLQKAQIDNAE